MNFGVINFCCSIINFFNFIYLEGKILSGHDISDGGLITCLLEMCFAGISGIDVDILHKNDSPINVLFTEEIGWVLEIREKECYEVLKTFEKHHVPVYKIGNSTGFGMNSKVQLSDFKNEVQNIIFVLTKILVCLQIKISVNGKVQLDSTVYREMKSWEETSYQLEKRQTNLDCALEEFESLKERKAPAYKQTFDPDVRLSGSLHISGKIEKKLTSLFFI